MKGINVLQIICLISFSLSGNALGKSSYSCFVETGIRYDVYGKQVLMFEVKNFTGQPFRMVYFDLKVYDSCENNKCKLIGDYFVSSDLSDKLDVLDNKKKNYIRRFYFYGDDNELIREKPKNWDSMSHKDFLAHVLMNKWVVNTTYHYSDSDAFWFVAQTNAVIEKSGELINPMEKRTFYVDPSELNLSNHVFYTGNLSYQCSNVSYL